MGGVKGGRKGANECGGDEMQLLDQKDRDAVVQRNWVGSGVVGCAPTSAEGNDMQHGGIG